MLYLFLLGPPLAIVLALLFGGLQWLVYRLLVSTRRIDADRQPAFIFLFFRGFLATLALILCLAIWSKQGMEFWEDPTLTPEAQEAYRKSLDPKYRAQQEAARREAFENQQNEAAAPLP